MSFNKCKILRSCPLKWNSMKFLATCHNEPCITLATLMNTQSCLLRIHSSASSAKLLYEWKTNFHKLRFVLINTSNLPIRRNQLKNFNSGWKGSYIISPWLMISTNMVISIYSKKGSTLSPQIKFICCILRTGNINFAIFAKTMRVGVLMEAFESSLKQKT